MHPPRPPLLWHLLLYNIFCGNSCDTTKIVTALTDSFIVSHILNALASLEFVRSQTKLQAAKLQM